MSRPAGPRDGGRWYDADAGPPVRPYAVTGGRTTPGPGGIRLDLVALVAVEARAAAGTLPGPEPAAGADLPVGVVRVLLGDLLEAGHVRVGRPVPPARLPQTRILRELIEGLRAL
ncbi:DUF742 domain-containing protein [Streptomyces globosus]|uniref:DUF742 domain-containing protein n=1 Tax=Streptomyces globosus TaxID=68209 RepID=UPI0037FD1A19